MHERPASEEQKSNSPSLLSDRDKVNLYVAGKNILQQLVGDYPHALPDAIIYPDVAARPLFYLMDPSLQTITKERDVPQPLSLFFKVLSTQPAFERINQLEDKFGRSIGDATDLADFTLKNINRKLRWARREPTIKKLTDKRDRLGDYLESNRNCIFFREVTRIVTEERAADINTHLRGLGIENPNLVIIDDVASVYVTAAREISLAFGKSIPVYAMLTSPRQEHIFPEITVRTGIESPYEGSEKGYFVSFDFVEKRAALGYTKFGPVGKIYSEPIKDEETDVNSMRQLRQEMRRIGERIAENT